MSNRIYFLSPIPILQPTAPTGYRRFAVPASRVAVATPAKTTDTVLPVWSFSTNSKIVSLELRATEAPQLWTLPTIVTVSQPLTRGYEPDAHSQCDRGIVEKDVPHCVPQTRCPF